MTPNGDLMWGLRIPYQVLDIVGGDGPIAKQSLLLFKLSVDEQKKTMKLKYIEKKKAIFFVTKTKITDKETIAEEEGELWSGAGSLQESPLKYYPRKPTVAVWQRCSIRNWIDWNE